MRLAGCLMAVGFAACGSSSDTSRFAIEVSDTRDAAATVADTAPDLTPEIVLPPDFGHSCNGNSDCVTDYCVEGPSGYVCTKTCVDLCPDGWGCRGVDSGSADVVFLCVPDGTPVSEGAPETIDDVSDTSTGETTTADSTVTTTDTTVTDTTTTGDTNVTDTATDSTTTTPTDTTPTDTTVTDSDTVVPPLGALCNPATPNGSEDFYSESPSNDFPDCVTGCSHAAQTGLWEIDLRPTAGGGHNGMKGTIDDGSHDYDVSFGPDIDTVAIRAPARKMLEFAVFAADGSIIDPVVYVDDGFAIRTYNGDYAAGNSCARTEIAYPYPGNVPIYVTVEHQHNYDAWSDTGYAPGSWVGGASYGYTMRIRQTDFAPVELGNVPTGGTMQVSEDKLSEGGQIRYYRFYASGTATATVTLRKTAGASAAFSPVVAGMKTMVNALEWQGTANDADGNGVVTISGKAFRPCVPSSECFAGNCNGPECTANLVEYVFAVLDFNGAAFPGDFAYTLEVNVQ